MTRFEMYSLLYFLVLLCATSAQQQTITYNGFTGKISHVFNDTSKFVTKFVGVPYAKPPVGELRFKPPIDMSTTNYSALEFKPACPQSAYPKFIMNKDPTYRRDNFNEDCLYLDIYVPGSKQPTYNRSVMVWIHGGAYFLGSGSEYDSSRIASEGDVVVVNINYRLGFLGFLPGSETVTLGLQDQVSALRWVQKHISKFGGDPNQVTIFGVSAGATSVALLTVSPPAKGLFKYAISQSGTLHSAWLNNGDEMERALDVKVKELCGGRSALECFKSMPAMDLVTLYNQITTVGAFLTPNVDGKFVMPGYRTDPSLFHPERYIVGFNTNDGSYAPPLACKVEHEGQCPVNAGISEDIAYDYIGDLVLNKEEMRTVIEQYNTWYPAPRTNDLGMKAAAEIATDLGYRLATNRTATLFAKTGKDIHVYEFNLQSTEFKIFEDLWWSDGAQHTEDTIYVFGLPTKEKDGPPARKIVKIWTDFAIGVAPYWARFEPGRPSYLYMTHDNAEQDFQVRQPLVDMKKDIFWRHWFKYGLFGTMISAAPGLHPGQGLEMILLSLICIVNQIVH